MTDKATVEITSPVSGSVISISGEQGDLLRVGAEMIAIESDSEVEIPEVEPAAPEAAMAPSGNGPSLEASVEPEVSVATTSAQTAPKPAGTSAESPRTTEQETQILAAPALRRRAREANVDLSKVAGTGRGGRITHEDLNAYLESGPGASPAHTLQKRTGSHEVKVIGIRRLIAEKMSLSKHSIPHFSYIEEVDVTELESLRQHMNAQRTENQPKLTYMPYLMRAITRLLVEFPQCNAHFDSEAGVVTQYDATHIGVATQTSNGLMVPVVKHAESLDLWELAASANRVSESARNHTASKDDLTGSTITITSLGALGGLASTPVINHPEVAIIGVNKTQQRPVIREGQIVSRLMMNLSSSFDHRIVDGYDAARFIQALKGMLEHPATIFI